MPSVTFGIAELPMYPASCIAVLGLVFVSGPSSVFEGKVRGLIISIILSFKSSVVNLLEQLPAALK
jgi:hypothetical protein